MPIVVMDAMVFLVALALMFLVLSFLPFSWGSNIIFLIGLSLIFLYFVVNITASFLKNGPRTQVQIIRTGLTDNNDAGTNVVYLTLFIIAVLAIAGALTTLDLRLRIQISFAQIISNLMLGIIYSAFVAPFAAISNLLSANQKR